jgi:hypothetical protein
MKGSWLNWLKDRRFRFQLGSFLAAILLALGLYAAGQADLPGTTWALLALMAFNQLLLLFL